MAKRKRDTAPEGDHADTKTAAKKAKAPAKAPRHGHRLAARHPCSRPQAQEKTKAKDTASTPRTPNPPPHSPTPSFNAHNSAIRCLALSPSAPPQHRRAHQHLQPPRTPSSRSTSDADAKLLSVLAPRPILENPKNRELGTLLHHASNLTRLVFPNRSKLLSAAEDSTVAVTRTRDWTLLHTFKCPIPKAYGRPSGDTAAQGGAPSGMVLAVSTEDGRVCFFSTAKEDLAEPKEGKTLKVAKMGRIKDFVVLPVQDEEGRRRFYVVAGSSDGRMRMWQIGAEELSGVKGEKECKKQVGKLLGKYETQNRITCVDAFVMIPRPAGAEESEYEFDSEEEDEDSDAE
ncbi:Protein mak11 [Collariella sp. IMI 366227]|nr:Protein mak11 [Collariella sp. IMI 366227]